MYSINDYSNLFMFVARFLLVIAVITIAIIVFTIICTWKIFSKAGIAGWKALIPLYNSYCLYSLAWKVKFFWINIIMGVVYGLLATKSADSITLLLIQLVISVVLVIFYILLQINLAKSFGQGGAFAIGLILLPIIFNAILAFSSNMEYIEKNRNEDSHCARDTQPDM